MGNLKHIVETMGNVRAKLDEADDIKNNTASFLNERFDASDKSLQESLKKVLKDQGEQATFASAVHQTVLSVTQNNQLMLHNMIDDLKHLERKLNEESGKLSKDISQVKTGVGSSSESLSKQINVLSKGIERLPTSFPVPKDVDLSKVLNGIMNLDNQVKNIPAPKEVSFKALENRLTAMETSLKKRVHVFEIERKNDQITKVTVRTK